MKRCDESSSCAFFLNYRLKISDRQHEFLVATYCEGDLQFRCRRKLWHLEKNESPPDHMLPNGYYVNP